MKYSYLLLFLLFSLALQSQINYYCYENKEHQFCALLAIDASDRRNSLLEFHQFSSNNLESIKKEFKNTRLQSMPEYVHGRNPNYQSVMSIHKFYGELGELVTFLFFDLDLRENEAILHFDKEDSRFVLSIPAEIKLLPF